MESRVITTVLQQLCLIRRLNESRHVSVTRDGKSVRVPSWEAVQDELDALIAFCKARCAMSFREQVKNWTPGPHVQEDERATWSINGDGSVTITLPSTIAANLADELRDWEWFGEWVNRPDCQNWKRSPIARENRRESIVYSNVLSSIQCLLGRRDVKALMARVAEIDSSTMDSPAPVEPEASEASSEQPPSP